MAWYSNMMGRGDKKIAVAMVFDILSQEPSEETCHHVLLENVLSCGNASGYCYAADASSHTVIFYVLLASRKPLELLGAGKATAYG